MQYFPMHIRHQLNMSVDFTDLWFTFFFFDLWQNRFSGDSTFVSCIVRSDALVEVSDHSIWIDLSSISPIVASISATYPNFSYFYRHFDTWGQVHHMGALLTFCHKYLSYDSLKMIVSLRRLHVICFFMFVEKSFRTSLAKRSSFGLPL